MNRRTFHLNLWPHGDDSGLRAIIIATDSAIEITKLHPMPSLLYFSNPAYISSLAHAVRRKLDLPQKAAITINLDNGANHVTV